MAKKNKGKNKNKNNNQKQQNKQQQPKEDKVLKDELKATETEPTKTEKATDLTEKDTTQTGKDAEADDKSTPPVKEKFVAVSNKSDKDEEKPKEINTFPGETGLDTDKKSTVSYSVADKSMEEPTEPKSEGSKSPDGEKPTQNTDLDTEKSDSNTSKSDTKPTTPTNEEKVVSIEETVTEQPKSKGKFYGALALVGICGLALGWGISTSTSQTKIKDAQTAITAKNTTISYKDLTNLFNRTDQFAVMLQQDVIGQIFENNHSDLVTDKEVDKEISRLKDEYGDSFNEVLKASGFNNKEFRTYTKQSLIMRAFVKKSVKIDDDDIKKAYENFIPEQTVKIAVYEDKKEAEKAQKDINGKEFTEKAEEIKLGTYSNERGLSNQIVEEAYKIEQDKASPVITEPSVTGGDDVYVVMKSVKHVEKKDNWKDYKDEIKTKMEEEKTTDIQYSSEIIEEELKKLDVKYNAKSLEKAIEKAFNTQITN